MNGKSIRKVFTILLVIVMVLSLTSTVAFAATMPCGHDWEESRDKDHLPADCGVSGHWDCDGLIHDAAKCFAVLTPPLPPGMDPPMSPPIEIEVPEDGSDLDLEIDEEEIKLLLRNAVWTISFNPSYASSPNTYLPEGFRGVYTLGLTVTGEKGSDIYGDYSGSGSLMMNVDTSGLIAMSEGHLLLMEMAWMGPINQVGFTLSDPYGINPGLLVADDEEENEEESLISLIPDDLSALVPAVIKTHLNGVSFTRQTWESVLIRNYFVATEAAGPMHEAQGPIGCLIFISTFSDGTAVLTMYIPQAAGALMFVGSISRKIDLGR